MCKLITFFDSIQCVTVIHLKEFVCMTLMYSIEMFSVCLFTQCSTADILFSFLVETCFIIHALTTYLYTAGSL